MAAMAWTTGRPHLDLSLFLVCSFPKSSVLTHRSCLTWNYNHYAIDAPKTESKGGHRTDHKRRRAASG
jgi:hypothetical protein